MNAATGEYVDMFEDGIVDAAKVTRSALQNAASIAALFLTTEALIADKPEKNVPAMPGGGGMGGGDMDFSSRSQHAVQDGRGPLGGPVPFVKASVGRFVRTYSERRSERIMAYEIERKDLADRYS